MFGYHLILEGYDTPKKNLSSVGHLYQVLDEYPAKIKMTKIMPPHVQQHLSPGDPIWGVSGFVIIAESHIAIHTFPEKNFISLDVFSCREFDTEVAIEYAVKEFGITRYKSNVFSRGEDYPKDAVISTNLVGMDRTAFSRVAEGA